MITFDVPLRLLAGVYFVLGFMYAWGLIRFFKNNFRWSLASVWGITWVVIGLYLTVWKVRFPGPEQAVYDMLVVFLASLPGMILVDFWLKNHQRKNHMDEIRQQTREILDRQVQTEEKLREILLLLEMRIEAKKYIEAFEEHRFNQN